MNRSKRLDIIVQLAKKKEDEAGKYFAEMAQLLEAEREKASSLKDYYEEYKARSNAKVEALSINEVLRNRTFLKQLADAGQEKNQHITQIEQEFLRRKNTWRQSHLKRRTFEDLVERLEREELTDLNKKEQKLLDEWFTSQNRES